jgi:hypothetical protein
LYQLGMEIRPFHTLGIAQCRLPSTLKSPQILELSGIGRRDVLHKIGVPLKLELEGVGENAQEHIWAGLSFRSLLSISRSRT